MRRTSQQGILHETTTIFWMVLVQMDANHKTNHRTTQTTATLNQPQTRGRVRKNY